MVLQRVREVRWHLVPMTPVVSANLVAVLAVMVALVVDDVLHTVVGQITFRDIGASGDRYAPRLADCRIGGFGAAGGVCCA